MRRAVWVSPFNGWVGQEVHTFQTPSLFVFLTFILLFPHLRPTWQPKTTMADGSWRKMLSHINRRGKKKRAKNATRSVLDLFIQRTMHTCTASARVNDVHLYVDPQGTLVPTLGELSCS